MVDPALLTPVSPAERLLTPSKITAWLDCGHYLALKHAVEAGTRHDGVHGAIDGEVGGGNPVPLTR